MATVSSISYVDETSRDTAGLPVGYRCLDGAGDRLGEVAGVLVDQSTHQAKALVLRTGNWLAERDYVVPTDQVSARDDGQRTLVLGSITKETLKSGPFPEYRPGEWNGDTPEAPPGEEATIGPAGEQRLELREEVLQATAAPYVAGRVRIGKRVVEREETVTVPLREEVLVIEHTGGEGSVRVGDRELRPGETMELVLYSERAEVRKVVERREAVTVRKEQVQRTEQVHDTVHREELEVREGAEFLDDVTPAEVSSGTEKPSPLPNQARIRPH